MNTTEANFNLSEKVELLLTKLDERKKQRDTTCAPLALEAYQLAKTCTNKKLVIKAATALTYYYTDITSEFDNAILYLKEIINVLDDDDDAEQKAEFYRRLGLNYDYTGKLADSKQSYDSSVRLLENKPELSETGFLTLGRSLFNQSIIYGDLGLDTLRKEFLTKSFGYFEKANYEPGLARCYISFGVDAYDLKQTEEAISFYEKAIVIAEKINDIPPYCIAMGNAGIAYADLGKKDKAVKCSEKSIELVKNQTNKHFELNIYQMAGRVYQLVQQYTKADQWFTEASKLYEEMGKAVDNFELFRYWSETLHCMGRHLEAYEKITRFVQQKDELHKLNKEAELNDATLRFEYEEGKKEQELLKKKNAEIEEYAHKLEMSNFELNQFAHVASHDLKEPLRMISNYSQLLHRSAKENMNADQKEYLFYINDGAKRMMNVIQNLLQLSKINATQKRYAVGMNEIIVEVMQSLKLIAEEKKVTIQSPKLPIVLADRVHMLQLWQNLIGNAIKYNNSEKPKVEICYEDRGSIHYFEISDNGIGIEPSYREKVFIIFQRLHHRNEYDGTGIGLAICKKIIDSLSGKIWIEDSALGGTKFCFTIPK